MLLCTGMRRCLSVQAPLSANRGGKEMSDADLWKGSNPNIRDGCRGLRAFFVGSKNSHSGQKWCRVDLVV